VVISLIKLDDDLLMEIGLDQLPSQHKKAMLSYIYETLEQRVGLNLAERMSDDQLTEFEVFIDASNEAGALGWLEINFPNYADVVSDEFAALKSELKAQAVDLLRVSGHAGVVDPSPLPSLESH